MESLFIVTTIDSSELVRAKYMINDLFTVGGI